MFALALSLPVALVLVTYSGEGGLMVIPVVLLLTLVLMGYLLWDLRRSDRAAQASVEEAVARLSRLLIRD